MKNIFIIVAMVYATMVFSQADDKHDAIKLFISQEDVVRENKAALNAKSSERLFSRVSQLINQVGITEFGYSTFLVTPKLDVISVSEDNAGIAKTVLAECELFLTINRVFEGASATMNTYSKKIMGSGFTKDEAISNAIGNIRSGDPDIKSFFVESKKQIDQYYKKHCKDVLKEANQALSLKDYQRSIALSFSVPRSATECYEDANKLSQKVYGIYVLDKCKKEAALMKSYAAIAQNDPAKTQEYYDKIIDIMKKMDVSDKADECYAVAQKLMSDIEKKLDEKQKQEWQLEKQRLQDDTELQKERYKAIQRIGSGYTPSTNVIIAR